MTGAGSVDPRWYGVGRAAAWLHGACYLGASLLFGLMGYAVIGPAPVDGGLPATAAELAARWAAIAARQRALWWPLFASNVLYLVGMLALVPLGLALRAR